MSKLTILTAPDPVLKTRSKPVTEVTDSIRALMADMLETMYAAPGIGLAAIQIGQPLRILVIDIAKPDKGETASPIRMVNPEIYWASAEMVEGEEGCLSVPEHYAGVERHAEIKVRYLDENGNKRDIAANGLLSTVIQHEMDHLDGKLFIDYISSLRRNMILRKLAKSKKLDAE
jgi:peptide deformylase